MNLINKIRTAEQQYLEPVEQFFKSVYREDYLVSHGIDHHRRVWKYAKELLNYLKITGNDPLFVKKLLIACYLHDIGMAIDHGTRHGIHSSDLCKKFFRESKLSESDFSDVLTAIENHDNKEYAFSTGDDILQTLLSVADDLDSFGYTGIYRYAEIYALRGVPYKNLGNLILDNADRRFENFRSVFREYPELIEKHGKRYSILNDFYKRYNNNLSNYNFKEVLYIYSQK